MVGKREMGSKKREFCRKIFGSFSNWAWEDFQDGWNNICIYYIALPQVQQVPAGGGPREGGGKLLGQTGKKSLNFFFCNF